MKLILVHADQTIRNQILQTLDELGHIIVAEPGHPGLLILALARHQPHALIIGKLPLGIPKEMVVALAEKCPGTPMLWLPEENVTGFIKSSLGSEIDKITAPPAVKKIQLYSTDGQRFVLHDDRYKPFARQEKLNENAAAHSDLERESDLFFRQVCCGIKNVRLF